LPRIPSIGDPVNQVPMEDVMAVPSGSRGRVSTALTFPSVLLSLLTLVAPATEAGQQPSRPGTPARAGGRPPAAQPAAPSGMTNGDIVNMVGAGLSEQIVMSAIRDAKLRNFDLTPNGLIALKKGGVTDSIIAVMLNPAAPPTPSAPTPPPAPVATDPAAAAPPSTSAVVAPPSPANAPVVPEIGVYYGARVNGWICYRK